MSKDWRKDIDFQAGRVLSALNLGLDPIEMWHSNQETTVLYRIGDYDSNATDGTGYYVYSETSRVDAEKRNRLLNALYGEEWAKARYHEFVERAKWDGGYYYGR